MDTIIEFNRLSLSKVPNWIELKDYNSPPSLFNYGLPNRVLHLINNDISKEITECDILCYLIMLLNKENIPINYLEIGVSVGKTFYQIMEYVFHNSKIYSLNCLDIEVVNPILNKLILSKFSNYTINEHSPNVDEKYLFGFNKIKNSITKWKDENNENEIKYYESNSFDKNIWKHMKKYNIIFSDGYHEPFALLNEYENLKTNNLIDFDKFVYCFDDLEDNKDGKMWHSVIKIFEDLEIITNQKLYLQHYVVNGWLGNNEYKHNFGIISNFEYFI
jgi:hypothetical protein